MKYALQVWDPNGKLVGVGCNLPLDNPVLDTIRASDPLQSPAPLADQVSVNGRTYERIRMELCDQAGGNTVGVASLLTDVSERMQTEDALRQRLEFEKLITHLSTHFIALKPAEIDSGIGHALEAIGLFCHVDRVYVFMFEEDGAFMTNTHEWCAREIEPQVGMLQHLPCSAFPWWIERIRRNEVIHVPCVEDMTEEARAERRILREQAIQSVVVVPALYQGAAAGFVGFDSVRQSKVWSGEDIALLRMVGEMLMSALERKRTEEERRKLEGQLIQARSLENVAKLAGGVAHDFNNLLAIILHDAMMLRHRLTDPALKELASDVLQVAKHGAALTRQLLIVGRRGLVEPVVVNLNDVVRDLASLNQKTLGENVALELRLTSDSALVRIGLPQLEQVILNLVINAHDAMPRGGVVEISSTIVDLDRTNLSPSGSLTEGRYVILTVRDTGVGMSSEISTRAFDPFFTTKGLAGTGLGLSTVHGVVNQAGGHAEIESTPGVGTVVRVYLPLVEADLHCCTSNRGLGVPSDGHGETVLVVEDSDRLRAIIRFILEQHRYRVIDEASPLEALRICEEHVGAIDLLLTDVIMPEMSGHRLAQLIQERFGLSKVLFMSGYDDEVLANQGIMPDGTWLLQKPFMDTDLLRFVRIALGD